MNIPNFADIPVVVKRGDAYYWSDEWRDIMQSLIQTLQENASEEGLVAPTQSSEVIAPAISSDITIIQDAKTSTAPLVYKTAYGTMLYDSFTNNVLMAINNGAGAPLFKTVQLV